MIAAPATRVLCLAQLPPPLHGAAVMGAHVADRTLNGAGWNGRTLRLTVTTGFQDADGALLRKAGQTLRLLGALVWQLLAFRPRVVYLAPSLSGLPLLRDVIVVAICRLARRPLVLHLHGTGLAAAVGWRRCALRWLLSRGRVITLAPQLVADLQSVAPASRVFVIPNAVSAAPAVPIPRPGRSCLQVLYLANFHPGKGIATAIEAFAAARCRGFDGKLRVVGAFTRHWREDDMASCLRRVPAAVRADIEVLGPAVGAGKAALLADADLFLYPSRYDAFPLAVLEAMAAGLPIVAGAQGAIPFMLDGGAGIVIAEADAVCYADALCMLGLHPAHRAALGRAARRRQRRRFALKIFDSELRRVVADATSAGLKDCAESVRRRAPAES